MKHRSLLELLQTRYPEHSKQRLYAAVLCGEVRVDDETVRDPKRRCSSGAEITLGIRSAYVSRGGAKLEHALSVLEFEVADKVMLDAGSSTGGFTDCLLQHGARAVHAVDVGYNQLSYRLRRDSRVVVHERTNIRAVTALHPPADRAVADLSFRSLLGVTGHIIDLTSEKLALVLCKPQFERMHLRGSWGTRSRAPERFDGVLRSLTEITATVADTILKLEGENVMVRGAAPSNVAGRRGNQEIFLLVSRPEEKRPGATLGSAAYERARDALIREIGTELSLRQ